MAATPEHAARVLGLSLDATLEDVRRVRRKMALKYHPDRSADTARSTRHMARINAAADTLIAFLKNKPSPRSAEARHAARASERAGKSRRSTGQSKSDARQQSKASHRPRTERPAGAEKKQESRPLRSKAELARIFRATESYAHVLERIGGQCRATGVDVRVMSFTKAA